MRPECCLSDLVREIKKSSNAFINKQNLTPVTFKWQEGYGAFSYNHSDINAVFQYINNQKEHHRFIAFKEEYLNLLNEFEVNYKEKYLFEWINNE
jgi:putative transposase